MPQKPCTFARTERGVALITTMLVLMLMSALVIGFSAAVMGDQRARGIDQDRFKAFYAAQSGIEKLNADLGTLFFTNVSPNASEIAALGEAEKAPALEGVTYANAAGNDPYGIAILGTTNGQISTGPYEGLIALKTEYELSASARTSDGGEAVMKRRVETVAIPVFQFGIFSDVDLSFHAGPNFNFGGRVHTNGNLFLAHGDGNTLTLPEKVTAVKEIVRSQLANGVNITASDHEGTISMARAPGSFRNLAVNEGSVTGGPTSSKNSSWPTISLSTYNGYIRNGTTGARALNLPLLTFGGANTDLVRRPAPNEDTANPTLLAERFFSKVSLRILLSDTAEDIANLPGVTSEPPVSLEDWVSPTGGHPPAARAPYPEEMTLRTNPGAGTADLTFWGVDPYFRPPAMSMTVGGTTYTVTCTGRTTAQNVFTGCLANNAVASIPVGTALTATVDGQPVSTTTAGSVQSLSNTTPSPLTVAAGSTARFVRDTMWVKDSASTPAFPDTLITCLGNNEDQLLSCSPVPEAVGANDIVTLNVLSAEGTGLVGGFIKIERQGPAGVWADVTDEILGYGIAGPNLGPTGAICPDPTPNAIIRLQRLRDNAASLCTYAGSTKTSDYWPNVLFDAREALYRDTAPAGANNLLLGGVMHYVALDVANLSAWFAGTGAYAGGTGNQSLSVNGYSVYFSDRRNNRNAADQETGEFGFEDIINPAEGGTPNGTLQDGEDVNANGVLDVYGQIPSYNGVYNSAPPGALAPLTNAARPSTTISGGVARVNRAILFRRALKLINGSLGQIVSPGLTIAAENPVYLQGDWNANQSGFGDPHVATSIIADAVTLLSNNWNDNSSLDSPYSIGSRPRSAQSYYRVAIIAGKNPAFPRPTVGNPPQDFGTDGGAHNFLRMLESGGIVNYRGSIATFYFSRQAVGVYKCCNTVYGAPTRNFAFDTDFLNPALLPPLTPVFRDINALGFRQETRPGH